MLAVLPSRGVAAAVGVCAVLSSAPSFGEVTSSIEWDAPASCPDTAALYGRLSTLLDGDLAALGDVRVRGTVVEAGSGLRLTLEILDAGRRNSRVLSAEDCGDLFEAAALAIALAVHGEGGATPTEGARSSRAVEKHAELPSPPPAALEMDAGSNDASWRPTWSVGAGAVVDWGALPALSPGVSLDARAHWGAWALGLYGILLPASRRAVGDAQHVDFGLMAAGLGACHTPLGGAFNLDGCVTFELGRLSASSPNLGDARTVEDLWLAPGVELQARWQLWRSLQLGLGASSLAPLLRKQYAVNGNERVHAPGALDFRLSAGLALSTN